MKANELKKVIINGEVCIIQSYLKNDFVNLCPIQDIKTPFNKVLCSFRITFYNNEIQTGGKESAYWKEFSKGIDINAIKKEVNLLF